MASGGGGVTVETESAPSVVAGDEDARTDGAVAGENPGTHSRTIAGSISRWRILLGALHVCVEMSRNLLKLPANIGFEVYWVG